MSPAAILTSDGSCRCNTEKGYALLPAASALPAAQICRCKPGWFMRGLTCTACPENSFCDDGMSQTLCPIARTSAAGSSSASDCYCAPGYFIDQRQKCRQCLINRKCDGVKSTECSDEEICNKPRTYLPQACPAGTTLYKNFQATLTKCGYLYNTYRNNSMRPRGEHISLYANVIHETTAYFFQIRNIAIQQVVAQKSFSQALQWLLHTSRSFCECPAPYPTLNKKQSTGFVPKQAEASPVPTGDPFVPVGAGPLVRGFAPCEGGLYAPAKNDSLHRHHPYNPPPGAPCGRATGPFRPPFLRDPKGPFCRQPLRGHLGGARRGPVGG